MCSPAKGYDTIYREFAGGHDYAWWRGLFADALQLVLPAQRMEPEGTPVTTPDDPAGLGRGR